MFRSKALRPIAGVVLVTFSFAQLLKKQPQNPLASVGDRPSTARTGSEEERFSRLLNEVHEILKVLAPQVGMRRSFPPGKQGGKDLGAVGPKLRLEFERITPLPGVNVALKIAQLRAKAQEIAQLEGDVRKSFFAIEQTIKDKNVPAELVARHLEVTRAFEARSAEFKVLVKAIEDAVDKGSNPDAALSALTAFMTKYPNQKPYSSTNPSSLPWGSPKPIDRKPYTTPEQFKTGEFFDSLSREWFASELRKRPLMLAQSGSLSGISLPSGNLPQTPQAEDLAESEDVQLTPAIRAKAAELGNQPVPIYNWVRNNIEFMPTYGSMQGADATLQTKRGNAFDIASLLVALLRAAGIPARYVYGTVEIPAEKVMNWVGGATVPDVAQNLMGQGGIPNVGVVRAGRVAAIRLEHIWVEAYVNYVPSRGAINRRADTWVPLDASFKQYEYVAGIDVRANVPFSSDILTSALLTGATMDPQTGAVQNLNAVRLASVQEDFATRTTAYIASRNPNPTEADLLGSKKIIADNSRIFYGTLPYKTIVAGAKFQGIPDNLRWKVRIQLQSDSAFGPLDPGLERTLSLPSIAGKRIGLSYPPATPADAALIQSFIDQAAASFPAYLVRLRPQLSVENALLMEGDAITAGTQQDLVVTMLDPANQFAQPKVHRITAGDEIVVGLDVSGITRNEISARFAQTPSTTVRENLNTFSLVYWYQHDLYDRIAASLYGVTRARLPSFGAFSAPLQTRYFFGIPRSAFYQSRTMDVQHNFVAAASENNANVVAFHRDSGIHGSYLEGFTFDLLLKREAGTAASAVRLLQEAAAAGQRIFKIDSQNIGLVLPLLQVGGDVTADIQNAVAAGKLAIVHERDIDRGNWRGSGHIIFDPDNGSGAYIIDGGFNGANSGADCATQPAPAPAPNPVPNPDGSIFFIIAIVIVAIIAFYYVGALFVALLVGGALAQRATAGPTPAPLPPELDALWNRTFGQNLGRFPTSGPYPGDGILPPGDCAPGVLAALEAEKDQLCNGAQNPMTCSGKAEDCDTIQKKIDNRLACMEKRLEIMTLCFKGGNGAHWALLIDHLRGLNGCQNCLARALQNQCKPE